jgi:hypothetical protein
LARTLEVSLLLNEGTVHRTPLPDYPIFTHLHILFGILSSKIGIYNLDFAYGDSVPSIPSMGRAYTNKK